MFKDYEKYLTTSLKVYLFVLIIIFILKIVGLDYFGIDINNPMMIKLEIIFSNYYIKTFLYFILFIVYQYLMISIIFVDNSKNMKKFTLFTIPFTCTIQAINKILVDYVFLTFTIELTYLYLLTFIYNKKNKRIDNKIILKQFIVVMVLNIIFEFISMLTRYNNSMKYVDDFIPNIILNLDYLLLLLISQKLVINKKGAESQCSVEEAGSSLLKKINLKKSLQKLQKEFQSNLKKFKKKDKVEKLTIVIFIALSLIWNILCVILVLLLAKLNGTFVECVFILTSFWLSKGSFGKAFHFDSMVKCFIVSNLTYYLLNRVTTPLGISIFVPILLGVGLSYVTSKFVKKSYKPLYRGMPEDVFEDTIEKVVDKNSLKYKICREFYIDKVSDVSLSFKYNYSVAGIRKIKDRINDKIKKLN